jgi:hypothetical protein
MVVYTLFASGEEQSWAAVVTELNLNEIPKSAIVMEESEPSEGDEFSKS